MTWRTVWCTGAGKGIGRALVLRLAREGCRVAVSARTEGDLVALAAEAKGCSGEVLPYPLDVTDEKAVTRAVDNIEQSIGPLDLVVLNAGNHIPVRAEAFSVKPFRDLVEINIMGVVHGLAAVLPRFIERKRGHVAIVASVAGYRGLPTAAAYGASKAALINMAESLKPELDRYGVRISVVNPGFVKTPLTDRNEFPMPFLIGADDAANRIVRGLRRGRFEIAFPRRFVWGLKVLRCLPYGLYFPLTRRLVTES
jgi:NAD(P)-dependent dehydrogenase (short-subunit alcohol dehydrogenase family)